MTRSSPSQSTARMLRLAGPAVLSLLLGAPLSACSDSTGAPLVERTDSAGVTIVRNLGGDRPLDWTFEPTLRLGGAADGPESFYRLSPALVDVDRRGNLYVLDPDNFRVVVFAPDGAHQRTLGRQGSGPGELEFISTLDVSPEGLVRVRDIAKPALVQWDSNGELLSSDPLPFPLYSRFAMVGGAMVAPVPMPLTEDGVARTRLLIMGPNDSTEVARIEQADPKMIDFGCVGLTLPPLFAPELVWDAEGSRVGATAWAEYAVRIVDEDRTMVFRRDLPPRSANREMAIRQIGDDGLTVRFEGGRAPCKVSPEALLDGRGFAKEVPAVEAMALSPDGSIWVRRGKIRDEPVVIDIFAADGVYLGTLPADSPFPAAFTPTGDVVAIEEDDMEIDHLVVYEVRREESVR